MHSKMKVNLKVKFRDKYDRNKQARALMPNLIHSLDASSLTLLYERFLATFSNDKQFTQFFSSHDCFATTCDKVSVLKTILASVYTKLYTNDPYLIKFDNSVFANIQNNTDYRVDRTKRIVYLDDKVEYIIHDMD